LNEEQRQAQWMGREPATAEQIVAAEQRLGIAPPRSLRGFLLVSNGWGPVSEWTDGLCSTEEIEWFRDANDDFIDGYLSGAEDAEEEIDQDNDIFLNALSVAYGEDMILLDTVHKSPDGEYEAYLLAVKHGELHETCASFSAAIIKGRAQVEYLRQRRAQDRG
jgi:SMI1 / KNR4 family (SUKH-1)